MSDSKAQRLAHELDEFIETSPNVEAAAVVSFDGLTMASALPEDMDDDRVGAMSAALLSLGEQAARGLGRGDLSQIFVEADEGFVFLMSAKDEAVLVAVTDRDAKIGFILFEMRRAAESVGGVLASRPAPVSGDRFAEFAALADDPAPDEFTDQPAYVAPNGDDPDRSFDHQPERPFEPHAERTFEPHAEHGFEPQPEQPHPEHGFEPQPERVYEAPAERPFEAHRGFDQHDGSALDGWR